MRIVGWVAVLASFGCTRDDKVSCKTAADAMAVVLLPDRPDLHINEVRGNLGAVLEHRCREDRWPAEARVCMRDAFDVRGHARCLGKMSELASQRLGRILANRGLIPPEPEPPTPTMSPDGRSSCEEYGRQVERIVTCDRIQLSIREQLAEAYRQASSAWPTVSTEEGKQSLERACFAAVKAVLRIAHDNECRE